MVDKSPEFVVGRWLELQDNSEMRRRGFVGKRGKIVSVDNVAKKATITLNHIHTGPIEVSYDDIGETW